MVSKGEKGTVTESGLAICPKTGVDARIANIRLKAFFMPALYDAWGRESTINGMGAPQPSHFRLWRKKQSPYREMNQGKQKELRIRYRYGH
jgi:hypothetical protein